MQRLTLEIVEALAARTSSETVREACLTWLHCERYHATARILAEAEGEIRGALYREANPRCTK